MKKIFEVERDQDKHSYRFPIVQTCRNTFKKEQPVVYLYPCNAFDYVRSKITFFVKETIDKETGKKHSSIVIRTVEDNGKS